MRHGPIWVFGIGTLLAGWMGATSALAQDRTVPKTDLPVVMTVYADASVDMRNILAACAPQQPDGWEEGAAVLIESLLAADVPAVVVAAIETKLATPLATDGIDCDGEDMNLRNGPSVQRGWEDYHRATLERAGVAVVEPVRDTAKLDAARAVVEAAIPAQAHMLTCLSLFNAAAFVDAYGGWSALLGRVEGIFSAAGYAPHRYRAILEPAAPDRLFLPIKDRGEATARCVADRSWRQRAIQGEWMLLASHVERALKAQP